MRLIRMFILAAIFLTSLAWASPDDPRIGKEYTLLSTPQPVPAGGTKIEVIEFFMYHCPACNAFEPALSEWLKRRADMVSFRRVHIPHSAQNDPEAHLFLTLDAMQLEGTLHEKVMRTWHIERRRLSSDTDNIEWAVSNGIDRQKFRSYYDSFSINAKLRDLSRYTSRYEVDSTPTLVIAGRYLTSPSMVAQANPEIPRQSVGAATLRVIDALVELARKEK